MLRRCFLSMFTLGALIVGLVGFPQAPSAVSAPSRVQVPLNNTPCSNGAGTAPCGRGATAMDFDSAHNQIVLFGGTSSLNQTLGDTWLWNGSTWSSVTPSPS